MPFHNRLRILRAFQYRKRKVRIVILVRGRIHCDLDHEPDVRRCTVCNRRLKPSSVVKGIEIDGEDIGVEFGHRDSIDEAVEFARSFIDEIDRKNTAR